jgi:hypothetical protein
MLSVIDLTLHTIGPAPSMLMMLSYTDVVDVSDGRKFKLTYDDDIQARVFSQFAWP